MMRNSCEPLYWPYILDHIADGLAGVKYGDLMV